MFRHDGLLVCGSGPTLRLLAGAVLNLELKKRNFTLSTNGGSYSRAKRPIKRDNLAYYDINF